MQTYMDAHHLKLNSEKAQLLIKNKGINNTHSELSLTMKGKKIIQSESMKVLWISLRLTVYCWRILGEGKSSICGLESV